jgi:PAS domain S-box
MSDLSELTAASARVDVQSSLATIALDDEGLIQTCSSACEKLFGYPITELLGHHVSLLLPKLEGVALIVSNDINPRLKYLCHCAIPFLARRRDGRIFAGDVFFNRLHSAQPGLQVIVRNLGMMPS